ncbi:MAG TPA: DUF4337 family protein [Puia sp.]|nr:DUF4337 family protein [Puia sp.]
MPEEIEIPTEHLHEQIEEGAEERRERWTLYLALSTAFMAVLAAFAGLMAGHHANEALVERMKASDQWNFYQAKNLKQEIALNTDAILKAIGPAKTAGAATATAKTAGGAKAGEAAPPTAAESSATTAQPKTASEQSSATTAQPKTASEESSATAAADHSQDIARYEKEKAEIKKQAEEDEQVSEAHLARHVPLSRAVTAFQIAIAISAIAVLTRRKMLWYAGLVLTAIGICFLIVGILP